MAELIPKKHRDLDVYSLCSYIKHNYHGNVSFSIENFWTVYSFYRFNTESFSWEFSELLPLLLIKLQDELKFTFLKESSILFPCIKEKQLSNGGISFDEHLIDHLRQGHVLIASQLVGIKKILFAKRSLSAEKINLAPLRKAFYKLEVLIFEWINFENKRLFPLLFIEVLPNKPFFFN